MSADDQSGQPPTQRNASRYPLYIVSLTILAVAAFLILSRIITNVTNERARAEVRAAAIQDIEALPPASSPSSIFPKKVETPKEVELFLDADNEQVLKALRMFGDATRGKAYGPEYLRGLHLLWLPAKIKGTAWYWDKQSRYQSLIACSKTLRAGSAVFVNNDGVIVAIAGCGNFFQAFQRNDAVTKRKVCVTTRPRAPAPRKPKPPSPSKQHVRVRKQVVTDEPVALAPPSRFIRSASAADVQRETFTQPQAGAILYGQGSGHVIVWKSKSPAIVGTTPTCDPGGQPPVDPPTDYWCY